MKILQISFHTAPFGNVGMNDSGGLNIYVEKVSNELSKNNDITVVTAEKAESFKKGNLDFQSLNLFDQELSVDDKEIYLQEFKTKLCELIDLESFDVIHAHYWLSGLVAKQIKEEFNIPIIFTSHSLGIFLDGYNKERVDCEKIIMNASNVVTASSMYEETMIIENYRIDSSKIKLIKPGVEKVIFTPDPTIMRENIFLSIGRIQEQKGQIETIKFLDNFRKIENNFLCYFIGGPSGKSGNEYFEELKKSITDLNLESHVEFLGSLSQSKIKDLMNRSKLLIHTSQFETFGLIAIEGNSMGVPVLTSNRGSLLEIIEQDVNGYVSENLLDRNVNNFVQNLIHDPKKFNEIMNNCISRSKNYDWKNTVKEIQKAYQIVK